MVLKDIRVENEVQKPLNTLTFGSYVNEVGIGQDEWKRRYEEFWNVSQYKKNMTYQTVVESSLRNIATSGVKYPNNYSSGDLYGDMFVTKSVLNPEYDMEIIGFGKWDNAGNKWADPNSTDVSTMIRMVGRAYLGLGSCSNQLSLTYQPIEVTVGYETH